MGKENNISALSQQMAARLYLTLLHSERPKLHNVLAVLSVTGLIMNKQLNANRKPTKMTLKVSHNKSIVLERPVVKNMGLEKERGRGLKPVSHAHSPCPASCRGL